MIHTRIDLFARLAVITLIAVAPFAVVSLYSESTADESQSLFIHLFAALAVTIFAAATLLRPGRGLDFSAVMVLAWAAWTLVSAAWAPDAWTSVRDFVPFAAGLSIYLLIRGSRVSLARLLLPAVGAVWAVTVLNSALADVQFISTKGPLAQTPLSRIVARSLGYGTAVLQGKANIRALFGHPNFLGGYLVSGLALGVGLGLALRLRAMLVPVLLALTAMGALLVAWSGTSDSLVAIVGDWRILALAAVIIGGALLAFLVWRFEFFARTTHLLMLAGVAAAVVICRSRSAWLAVVVVALVLVLVAWRHRRARGWHVALVLVLIALGAYGVLQLRQARLRTSTWQEVGTLSTLTARMYDFMLASQMIRERPVLGWGHGAFKTAYYDFVAEFQQESANAELFRPHLIEAQGRPPVHVHNDYLEIAVETGLIGLLLFLGFVSWALVGLARLALRPPAMAQTWLALSLLAALLAILVDMIMSFPLGLPLNAVLFWVLIAAAHRLAAEDRVTPRLSAPASRAT